MPDNDQTSVQVTPASASIGLLDGEIRKVIRCPHCNLVQFLPKNAMCRCCHKPLPLVETEESCVSPEPAC